MADKFLCLICQKTPTVLKGNRYRQHQGADGSRCDASGTVVSPRQLALGPIPEGTDATVPMAGRDFDDCPDCGRQAVPVQPSGDLVQHRVNTHPQGALCLSRAIAPTAAAPTGAAIVSSGSQSMSNFQQPWNPTAASEAMVPSGYQPPSSMSAALTAAAPSDSITPTAKYQQPGASSSTVPSVPMPEWESNFAASIKQLFFHYNQRRADDNRSAQRHLGPSEIGTPCDRRLVMRLLGVEPVNPGGDGWAAWVGTQGHKGMAEVMTWADGGSGRYAVEMPLRFPSVEVPRGTGDLLDRTEKAFVDWKFMGQWSLKKLKAKGPSETYRVQLHVYCYGARLRGEDVDRVALVAMPRDQSSLDDMWVWSEPYRPDIAAAALKRVADLADRTRAAVIAVPGASEEEMRRAVWSQVPFDASECRFCDYHAPNDQHGTIGCAGK